jgi:hypothetical protein
MTTPTTDEVAHDYESLMNEADQLMEDLQLDEAPPLVIDGFSIDGDEFALDGPDDFEAKTDDPPAPSSSVIHPLQEGFLTGTTPPKTTNVPTNVASDATAGHFNSSPSLDQIKAQTSKFASSFASFAHKAASQVAAAAAAAPTSYGIPQTMNSSNIINYSNYGSPSFVMPSGSGAANVSGTAATQPMMPPGQLMPVELDNETKSRLIKEHVGDLLPGERVIMFLSNLLHVSDSTGFSFVANTSMNTNNGTVTSQEMWCCVMTYFRLVLFGTHQRAQQQDHQKQQSILPRPDWNPTCWPSPSVTHPHLLEIPLASMERVEKSVYSAGKPAHTTSLVGLVIFG